MPIRPFAVGIALLALAIAIWLILGGIRRHRWLSLLRIPPIVCCVALVALLVPTVFGFAGPHPFFNQPAPISSATVLFFSANPDPRTTPSLLVAASARTGKTLWQRPLQGPLTTFVGDGQVVYTTTYFSDASEMTSIAARNGADGALLWQHSLSGTRVADTPFLADGALYLDAVQTAEHAVPQLLAVRATDGKTLWSVPIGDANSGGAVRITATADTLYVEPNASTFQARRRSDGNLLWTRTVDTGSSSVGSCMVAGPNALYICAEYGAVTALSATSGAVLWTYGNHDFFHSGVFSNDTLYVSAQHSGNIGDAKGNLINPETVYALDANSGVLLWRFATQSHNSGTLAVGAGNVYIQADDGIHTLRAHDGAVLWHSDPHNSWTFAETSPVLGSALYVTAVETLPPDTLTLFGPSKGQTYLYAVNSVDGSAYWGMPIGPIITIFSHFVT
jgi:outer membrane protein assembly factor BamB